MESMDEVRFSDEVVLKKAPKRRSEEVVTISYSDVEEDEEMDKVPVMGWGKTAKRKAAKVNAVTFSALKHTKRTEDLKEKKLGYEEKNFDSADIDQFERDAGMSCGSDWISRALSHILETEMKTVELSLGDSHPRIVSKLNELCKKVSKKVATSTALRELDKNIQLPRPKDNPKNEILRQRKSSIQKTIDNYRVELDSWQRELESRSEAFQEIASKTKNDETSAASSDESSATSENQLDNTKLSEKIDTAIVQLQFSNARLRATRSKDFRNPEKLIKALTQSPTSAN